MFTLKTFYKSQEWEQFRQIIIAERIKRDGFIKDDITGEPIIKPYDCILHHKTELTEDNVNDYNISLNPENIQVVSFRTHNEIHKRFGYSRQKKVYLIYGPPCGGKLEYINGVAGKNDLILYMDNLWSAIKSNACGQYEKPNALKGVIFAMRDNLLDLIKTRYGKWETAFIIGGYPLISDREALIDSLGIDKAIFIDTPKEDCLIKAAAKGDNFVDYVKQWFDCFTE